MLSRFRCLFVYADVRTDDARVVSHAGTMLALCFTHVLLRVCCSFCFFSVGLFFLPLHIHRISLPLMFVCFVVSSLFSLPGVCFGGHFFGCSLMALLVDFGADFLGCASVVVIFVPS